jgi:F-type H+-transporting ATPase subunit delta
MTHNFTTARPYARAIFETARDTDQLQPWLLVIQGLAAVTEVLVAEQWVGNPRVSNEQLVSICEEVLQSLCSKEIESIQQPLHHLIQLLVQQKRLPVIQDMAVIYQQLLREYKAVTAVDVISAFALSAAQCKLIQSALQKRFDQAVTINYQVDADLIGGTQIRAGNWVMDGSVRGSLDRLADRLERTL